VNAKQRAALDLLVGCPDSTVAEMLGVAPSVLRRWLRNRAFSAELRAREAESEAELKRMAGHAALNSAVGLCRVTAETSKPDPKLLLETLKASGVFSRENREPSESLADVIRKAASDNTAAGERDASS